MRAKGRFRFSLAYYFSLGVIYARAVPAAVRFEVRWLRSMEADSDVDACSCEKASDGGVLPTETDFTTKAAGA